MNRPKQKSATVLKREVEAFNQANPVGSKVTVKLDSGTVMETTTTSEAWTMGGHSNVIMLDKVRGCYALERVTAGWSDATENDGRGLASAATDAKQV